MRLSFLCRASTTDGVGHFVRTTAVVQEALAQGHDVQYIVHGDPFVHRLAGSLAPRIEWIDGEDRAPDLIAAFSPDRLIIDLLRLEGSCWNNLRSRWPIVSLSPIFNHLDEVDLVVHRTRCISPALERCRVEGRLLSGLQWAVVGGHCRTIREDRFREELAERKLSIALSMGGADSENRTLKVLQALRAVRRPTIIWVALGAGYSHSYDEFIQEANRSPHEVVLVNSNESIWRILSSCVFAVLAGGVTTYEAAHAGLPSINLLVDPARRFLIQEIEDHGAAIYGGVQPQDDFLESVSELLERPEQLLEMHRAGKRAVDGGAAVRILARLGQSVGRSPAPTDMRELNLRDA